MSNTMSTMYGPKGGVTTQTAGTGPGPIQSDLLDFAKEMARRRYVLGPQQSAPMVNRGIGRPTSPIMGAGHSTMTAGNDPAAGGGGASTYDPLKVAREQALVNGPPKIWNSMTHSYTYDPTSPEYKRWSVLTGDNANKGEAKFDLSARDQEKAAAAAKSGQLSSPWD